MMRASQFVQDELIVRLAHRAVELENLPHNLSEMPSVKTVQNWYVQSFTELMQFPAPEDFKIPKHLIATKESNLELY